MRKVILAVLFVACMGCDDDRGGSIMAAVVHKQDTDANGYSTTDDVHKTRMPVVPFQNAGGSGTGETYTKLETRYRLLMSLLQSVVSGQIVRVDGGGLNVGMLASPDGNFDYWLNGTKYTVAEDASFAVTASVANHISVDATGVLEKTTGAWPGTDHWKLAIVTCDGSEVTAIKDCRLENLDPAAANGWFNIAAGADVDMAGFDLTDIGELDFGPSVELTIATGVITPTQVFHTVDTEADAASDFLVTITATAARRRLLILTMEDAGRSITINETGNITLSHGSNTFVMSAGDYIGLLQTSATVWTEIFRSESPFTSFSATIDGNNKLLHALGLLAFEDAEVTIAAGVIGPTATAQRVDTEADAGTDDLDTITLSAVDNLVILLRPEHTARTVVVKHNTGNILLAGGKDFTMDTTEHTLTLRQDLSINKWVEVSRSHWTLADLVGTGFNVPYSPGTVVAGTNLSGVPLSQRLLEIRQDLPFAGKIINVTGHVNTSPSGGTFVCDVLLNGVTIFASGGERINIDAGQNEGTSATKDATFAPGDTLTYQVTSLWSADDLTIVPKLLVDLQAAP